MSYVISRAFIAWSVVFFVVPAAIAAEATSDDAFTLYVAPNGNDAWSGSLREPNADKTDGPFATITRARDYLRDLRPRARIIKPIAVFVREGTYRISESIAFATQDSGGGGMPVTIAAYPGEKPVISGGVPITAWRVEGEWWVAELPEVASGVWNFTALWVNGAYRHRARTPNEGFLYTAGRVPGTKDPNTGEEKPSNTAFVFDPGDIRPWENLEDVMVVVMHSWDSSYHHIQSIDEENRVVTFTGPSGWPFEHWGPKQRYFVENYREALDRPGEWYLDRKKGLLYYRPMAGETPDNTEIIAPRVTNVIRIEGDPANGVYVNNMNFRGLRLYHTNHLLPPEGMPCQQAAYPVPGAIDGNGARMIRIEDCEIAHVGTYGIWLREGCTDNVIRRNHVHELGAGGVRIGVGNNPKSEGEATLRNVVDNNWIHDGGKIFPAAVGVYIGRSSHNIVSHNEISDLYYTGISVGWSWGYDPSSANHNVIEHNHIHNLGKYLLSDMGGIYTLGIAPGTTLRYNRIHDVYSFTYGGWGIYPDEGSSELLIENNVVYDTKTGGFHQHYGKENRVRNNIFAFSREGQVIRSREEDHISFFFERNIVYFDNGRLLGSTWKNGNFRLDYNCYWDASGAPVKFLGKTFEDWQATGQDPHSIIADPLFEDPAARDFRLKPESPAIAQLGFEPIDISGAGLYGDPEWVNAPRQITRAPYGPTPEG
jgi:hypothetical protein